MSENQKEANFDENEAICCQNHMFSFLYDFYIFRIISSNSDNYKFETKFTQICWIVTEISKV